MIDKLQALGYNRIMKNPGTLLTFKFNDDVFQMTDTVNDHGCPDNAMEAANDYFDLPQGAWFGPEDGSPKNTWIWRLGNYFD